jgi:mono/diheme cytochrome c family protein
MKKNNVIHGFAAGMLVLFVSFALLSMNTPQNLDWEVPAKYNSMKNPVAADAKMGMMLYNKNCASCHGKKGLGDGPKSRTLETFSGDFSSAAFQDQSDGAIFYKTKFGMGEMPAYDKKISDEDIWLMVHQMRTFKK